MDVVAAEFAVERTLQVDKLIVCDLPAFAERGERRVLFRNLKDAGIHTALVLFDEYLVPAFADRDVAVGRDEVGQVDLQEGAGAVASVLHLRRQVTDDLRELRWRGGGEVGESTSAALGDERTRSAISGSRLTSSAIDWSNSGEGVA